MAELEVGPACVGLHSSLSFLYRDLKATGKQSEGIWISDLILTFVTFLPWEYREKGPGFSLCSSGSSPAHTLLTSSLLSSRSVFLSETWSYLLCPQLYSQCQTHSGLNKFLQGSGWMNKAQILICGLGFLLPALPTFQGSHADEWGQRPQCRTALSNRSRRQVTNASHECNFKLSSSHLTKKKKKKKRRKEAKLVLILYFI